MANLRIKLVKSLNGRLEKHIATAHSLGQMEKALVAVCTCIAFVCVVYL